MKINVPDVLFAQAEVVTETGFFPPYFGVMLLAMALVFAVVMVLFVIGYKGIDLITPGDLSNEIVPKDPTKKPNVALAIMYGSMVLGLSIILAATIVAVMVH
jgi:uncharacterized membrane protein YjfL (UPF0719 family)